MNLTKRTCLMALLTLFVGAGTSLAQSRIQLAQGKRVIQEKVSFVIDVAHEKSGNPRYAEAPEDMRVWMRFAEHVVTGKVLAEHPNLVNGEFNRAFVLMQYFGYLRRNPNDSPDGDYTGYDFWLTKLNQFNGNYANAEMVKAFITSAEYRKRFAQ